MKQHWNEVQPVDSFQVTMKGILHRHDQKVITFLYQPLIGPICTSLYNTLWHTVLESRVWSEEWTHYHLMNMLDINLQEIYEARLKLEGIGLIKTYIKKEGDIRTFIYELLPPLSAEEFFTDGMLNIYLYQQLGQTQFVKLKRFFTDKVINQEHYAEITRSFQDVFTSIGTGSLSDLEAQETSNPAQGETLQYRVETEAITIDKSDFNFDLLLSGLSEVMVPRRVLTTAVKEAIGKLAFLYRMNAIDMKNIVLSSLTAEQTIDIDELRKAARDWFQMENGDQLPKLIDRRQLNDVQAMDEKNLTKEEKLVRYLETTSPRQLLIDLSEGAEPARSDMQAIEEVLFAQKMEIGVMNVLIHYVMLRTDMKLSKSYLEKIASHWSRKKIKTVKAAMELAKSEHRQYQEWASGKKEQKQRRKQPIRTEKLPDWFVTGETAEKQPAPKETEELQEKRRRLEAIQRKYQKPGGEKGGENQ